MPKIVQPKGTSTGTSEKPKFKVVEFKDQATTAEMIKGLTIEDFENGAWASKIEGSKQFENGESQFIIDCLEQDEFQVIEVDDSYAPGPGLTWIREIDGKLSIWKVGPAQDGAADDAGPE